MIDKSRENLVADGQMDRQTERQTDKETDRQTDGRTDESDFVGCCPTKVELQISMMQEIFAAQVPLLHAFSVLHVSFMFHYS